MQTIKGTKSVIKNGLARLNFCDTCKIKNNLNTLIIENIDGAVKHTRLHITDIINYNLISF